MQMRTKAKILVVHPWHPLQCTIEEGYEQIIRNIKMIRRIRIMKRIRMRRRTRMIRKGSMIRASELGLKDGWYVHNHSGNKGFSTGVDKWYSSGIWSDGYVATCTRKG